jgi:tRNA dimethylallyltransferase
MPAAQVIAIFGPTAVGKTGLALALADRIRSFGEDPVAVSADALQVYRGLELLSGVASAAEQARLEHRLVSFLPLHASFSAGAYAELAHAEIDALLAAGQRPLVVGGTGLYLRAALAELTLAPPPGPGVRERWLAELARVGPRALHDLLAQRAPAAAAAIAATDSQRIVRALELDEAGWRAPAPARSELWTEATRKPTLLIGLTLAREQLYAQIDARVDAIVAAGARAEVARAAAGGAGPPARQARGFEELLAGDVAAMKRRTRQYARRQLTWMRKLAGVWLLDLTDRDLDSAADEIARRWQAR